MQKIIKYTLHNFLKSKGFFRKKYIQSRFLGKEYKVIQGTIKLKPDKDDAWLFRLSKEHKIIFDIGANIGQSSMLMLHHDSVEKVILVDPNPQALVACSENHILNRLSNRTAYINAFISDETGDEVDFYTVGTGAAGSKYKEFATTANKLNSFFKVQTLTLDDLCKVVNLEPDFVKIDVEGAEIEVLKGAVKLAENQKTIFFVEIHSGVGLSIFDNTQMILDWCTNNKYKAWYLTDKNELNLEVMKHRGGYHALLLPEHEPFPDYLLTIDEFSSIVI